MLDRSLLPGTPRPHKSKFMKCTKKMLPKGNNWRIFWSQGGQSMQWWEAGKPHYHFPDWISLCSTLSNGLLGPTQNLKKTIESLGSKWEDGKNNKYNGSKKNLSANLVGRRKCRARERWRRGEQSLAEQSLAEKSLALVAVTFPYLQALCVVRWFDECWRAEELIIPSCRSDSVRAEASLLCERLKKCAECQRKGCYDFKLLVYIT